MTPSIFEYSEPSLYLRDVWMEKKKQNARFTIRAWAHQLNLKYHNPLHEIISGKRKLPKSYVPALIKNLNFSIEESFYLETLLDLQKAKTFEEKEMYLERLKMLSPKSSLNMHEVETFRSLKDPLHIIITELSCLKDFKNDPSWIQNKLGFKRSLFEIEEAIDRLVALGLMWETENGELKKVHQHTYSKNDVLDKGLQEYHKNVIEFAANAISKQDILDREYNAYCINIQKSQIPEAKKLIRKFMNDFAQVCEAPEGKAEDTYQLNVQLFNLTKDID